MINRHERLSSLFEKQYKRILFERLFSNDLEMKLKAFVESEGHQYLSIVQNSCLKGCLGDVMLLKGVLNNRETY